MLPSPLVLVLATLAVYRVAYMVTTEDGPLNVFTIWRGWVFEHYPDTWIDRGMNCVLCASFWLSLPAALAMSTPAQLLLVWFGMAGAIVVIHNR